MESCCCNALRTNFSCYRLNDICDALSNQRDALKTIRGATPPSRNGLSNANKIRDAAMAEELFWSMLKHLQTLSPNFGCEFKSEVQL